MSVEAFRCWARCGAFIAFINAGEGLGQVLALIAITLIWLWFRVCKQLW